MPRVIWPKVICILCGETIREGDEGVKDTPGLCDGCRLDLEELVSRLGNLKKVIISRLNDYRGEAAVVPESNREEER